MICFSHDMHDALAWLEKINNVCTDVVVEKHTGSEQQKEAHNG